VHKKSQGLGEMPWSRTHTRNESSSQKGFEGVKKKKGEEVVALCFTSFRILLNVSPTSMTIC